MNLSWVIYVFVSCGVETEGTSWIRVRKERKSATKSSRNVSSAYGAADRTEARGITALR